MLRKIISFLRGPVVDGTVSAAEGERVKREAEYRMWLESRGEKYEAYRGRK